MTRKTQQLTDAQMAERHAVQQSSKAALSAAYKAVLVVWRRPDLFSATERRQVHRAHKAVIAVCDSFAPVAGV